MTLTLDERASLNGRPRVPPLQLNADIKILSNLDLRSYLKTIRHCNARVGLICNQASVDHGYRHAADLLHEHADIQLTALFGPQHGIRGDVQDNMIETGHSIDRKTVCRSIRCTAKPENPPCDAAGRRRAGFDMQDVGCRIYAFVYTLANCMRAARRLGKVIVCDRPNLTA